MYLFLQNIATRNKKALIQKISNFTLRFNITTYFYLFSIKYIFFYYCFISQNTFYFIINLKILLFSIQRIILLRNYFNDLYCLYPLSCGTCRHLKLVTYFAGQGAWLQMRLFASGRGIPSQKFGVTLPPCSSMQDASDIYANRWHVLRIKAVAFAVALGIRVYV